MTNPDPRPIRDARWFIHLLLSAILLAVAVQLFRPGNTYGAGTPDGPPAGNWALIGTYMSEKTAGCLFWAVGCVGLIGLSQSPWVRLASVLVLATAHGLLAASFIWSNPDGSGAIWVGGYAAAGYYLAFRRTREVA